MTMARKLKRPDGAVVEEFVCSSTHYVEGGKCVGHCNETLSGDYTGVFWFEFPDGRFTKRHTVKTAPKWLLALYYECTGSFQDDMHTKPGVSVFDGIVVH